LNAIKRIAGRAVPALTVILLSFFCRAPLVMIPTVPPSLAEIEGYASLKITRSGETAKSKFAFVLDLPHRAKVEIQDPLGRKAAEILINDRDGYFILSSEKAYWRASPDEIMEKFLGFRLSLREMTGLLCGRWKAETIEDQQVLSAWKFHDDAEGRMAAGWRGNLEFTVLEFFPGSPVPRRLEFRIPDGRGNLGILAMAFNKPLSENAWTMDFMKAYASKTWADIEKMLRHED
jgi:outer membrane biogenesis lipoprotein LolB